MIIYKAVNKINGKIYIGQSVHSLEERIAIHIKSRWKKQYFPNALRKYGIQMFEFSIIDTASSREVLDAKEQYWIRIYDCMVPNGYNMTDGGGGTSGYKLTPETKRKLSEINTGEKHPMWGKKRPDLVTRMKGHTWNKGTHRTEETRKKMSMAAKERKNHPMWGKHHSEETKRKMSEAKWGKHLSEETRNKMSEGKKGKPSALKGRPFHGKWFDRTGSKHSEESKRKMGDFRRGKKYPRNKKENNQ